MISEILAQHAWFWPLAWQSTTVLALGLIGSFALRKRTVRAHRLLLLALVAAIAVPMLSLMVKQRHWGLLTAKPTAIQVQGPASMILDAPAITESTRRTGVNRTASSETVTSALPTTTTATPVEWRRLVLPVWAVLSIALLMRLVVRFLLGHRLAQRSEPRGTDEIARAIAKARVKLGIRADVLLHQSPETRSPVIWCWGARPTLLVPRGTGEDDSIDWESVVCHELAHWKRRDHISSLWAELVLCVLPWNPLTWLAQRRLKHLSEQACDDWVIAAGQVGTRYARTLLGLTPQGRAALIPAVVSSKKGLATRVRRILTDQCASPHSGWRWSLATGVLVIGLAVTIAFAQAKPAEPADSVKTALGHGAVIERLASTATIKGVVLDPNGQPVTGRFDTTAITVLPVTTHSVRAEEDDGQFEIPWSPAWLDPGQAVHLVARDAEKNLGRVVTVDDPTKSVTINLTPATAVKGQVFAPDGKPIHKASAILSLPVEFDCFAPVASGDTNPQGAFVIKTVPNDQTYTMDVYAKGYQSKQMTVTATDAREMDLGSITLQPLDRPEMDEVDWSPNPNWKEAFDKIHRLNEGEVVKLLPAPFSCARQDKFFNTIRHTGHTADMLNPEFSICTQYRWDGHLEDGWWHSSNRSHVRIRTAVHLFLGIRSYEFDLPQELGWTSLPSGDWIVSEKATTEEKLRAVREIIQTQLQKPIHLEQHRVERDTIVVTGRYAFTPLPDKDPNRLYVVATEDDSLYQKEADSLPELFEFLANSISVAIDNRMEPQENAPIPYTFDHSLRFRPIDHEKDLPVLLENLTKQTGLTFKVERRPADVWFISENTREERG